MIDRRAYRSVSGDSPSGVHVAVREAIHVTAAGAGNDGAFLFAVRRRPPHAGGRLQLLDRLGPVQNHHSYSPFSSILLAQFGLGIPDKLKEQLRSVGRLAGAVLVFWVFAVL